MFQKVVTNKDGVEKRVFANEEADLKDAMKELKGQTAPTYPNINVPRRKGEDLVEVGGDMSVGLVDGRGAHNSPYDAFDKHNKENGESDMHIEGLDQPAYLKAGTSEGADEKKGSDSDSKATSARKTVESTNTPAAKQNLQEDGTNRASNVAAPSETSMDQGQAKS